MPDHDLQEPLKRVWGHESLRPLQEEAVRCALAGRDTLVVMPTGGGKSLCFQLPPLVDGGLTLVVSPLISLMQDQVDGLKLVGYPAAALHSNIPTDEQAKIRAQIESGELKLLYVSPERLFAGSTVTELQRANQGKGVSRVAIDEAHCISHWGHDFRPEYRQLRRVRTFFPSASVHALTATATPQVRDDIALQLALKDPAVLVGTFDRPNLTYRVVPKVDAIEQALEAIRRHPEDASIVYCLSRKDTEVMAGRLKANGIYAATYHAGMSPVERQAVSEGFAQERVNVVVATVAFGMGIDRSNVRVVIHESMPTSIEAYQQETGRAGRDGLPSECLMLYDPGDVVRRERLLRDSADDVIGHRVALLHEVRKFALSTQCRHAFLSEYFGQEYPTTEEGCNACDLCLEGWQAVPESTKKSHMILAIVRALDRQHGTFGFGAGHIAAILGGADTVQIRKNHHNEIKGYGSMRGTIASRISGWVNQVADQGFLVRTGDQFPSLHLSEKGADALQNRTEITLRDLASPAKEKGGAPKPEGFDPELFEGLRGLRREIATERGVPAYVLFHDAALILMATARPTTVEGLRKIPGVGERKSAELGPVFLERIREESERRGLTTDSEKIPPVPKAKAEPPKKISLRKSANRDIMWPLFAEGMAIAEVAERVSLSILTVSNYLAEWIVETMPASLEPWVDDATAKRVEAVAKEVGTDYLKPIFDALEGSVEYERVRLVVARVRESDTPST